MFNKIVAMLVMACALLMGAPAWAQAPAGIEKTHRASENVGTLWETCVRLFTLEKATAKCWMNTLRLKADGTLERVDPTNVKAGEILYFGIPTPVLKEEAQKALGGAQAHSNTVGTTDNAKAGIVPAPAKPQASQDTALEAMKPQSNVLPETNTLAPLAVPSAPTLTEDLVFQTPEQINPETGTSVPVNSGATEASSTDKFLENFLRTTLFSVILILTIISMFVGAEYRNDLGYFSKLSSTSRKTTLKVVDPKKELEKKSRKFYAQSAQALRARKPATDLTAPIKRFAANGGRIATGLGKKASLFLVRPGVKTKEAKKEKWAGRSEPVVGPKMKLFAQQTAYIPPTELAKANAPWNPDLLAQPTDIDPEVSPIFEEEKQEDLVVQAKEPDVVQATDWMARINAHRNTALVAQEPEKVPGAKWYVPPGIAKFRACKVRLAIKGMFSKTGTDTPFVLWFREQPDGHLEWFNPVAEAQGKESEWVRATPRMIEGLIGRNFELQEKLGIELNDNAIKQANDKSPGRILVGDGFSLEDVWKQMPPRDGVIVPMRDPTKDAIGA